MGSSKGYVDYESVGRLYQRGRALPNEVLDRWRDVVVPLLPVGTVRVADVGAGTGIFAAAWPHWYDVQVVAVEPTQGMADAAAEAGVPVTFVRGVAEDLPFHDHHLDVVWVSAAFHHFVDTRRAVAEFARVLRPGGRVFLRTYLPGRTEVSYADKFPGRAKWIGRFHTEAELRDLFCVGGFEVVDVTDVLEWEETFAASADWVEMMRDADSMLTALSDEDIRTGIEALHREPDRIGRLETSLVTFERL